MRTSLDLQEIFKRNYANLFFDGDHRVTYGRLEEEICVVAAALKKQLPDAAVIATHGLNHWQFFVLLLASWQNCRIVFPLNSGLTSNQIAHILDDCPAGALISNKAHKNLSCPVRPFGKLLTPAEKINASLKELSLEQRASIIMTSGSSGKPKFVVHTIANHFYSALGINRSLEFGKAGRWLLCLPHFHVAGLAIFLRALLAEATVVVSSRWSENAGTLNLSHASLVATQLWRLKESGAAGQLQKCKILLGGSAVDNSLLEYCKKHELEVYPSYGLTEMASTVAVANLRHPTRAEILPFRGVRIAANGEIALSGETRFLGYLEKGRLRQPFDNTGRFLSSDIGRLDDKGRLTVLGRKDNMFICAGENVHPEQLEKALLEHKDISQAFVVDIADSEYGHVPVAFTDSLFDEPQQLRLFLRKHLEPIKIPRHFFRLPAAGSDLGKHDRSALRKLAAALLQKKAPS